MSFRCSSKLLSPGTPDERPLAKANTVGVTAFSSWDCEHNANVDSICEWVTIAALKFCFKTCVAMKFVDDDDGSVYIARLDGMGWVKKNELTSNFEFIHNMIAKNRSCLKTSV